MAKAQIVYTNVADTSLHAASGTIYVDMGTAGGLGSIQATSFGAADFILNFPSSGSPAFDSFPRVTATGTASPLFSRRAVVTQYPRSFASGATIDASTGTWATIGSWADYLNFQDSNTYWPADGASRYLGVRFDAGSGTVYGWMRLSYNADRSLTIYDFAYSTTPGAAVVAGAIPEPAASAAAAGLAALLAGSVALYRRRQKQQTAA